MRAGTATIASYFRAAENYTCEPCNKTFTRMNNFLRHMKIHEKKSAYKCPECDKELSRSDALLHHLRAVHQMRMDEECRCKYCGQRFSRWNKLMMHMQSCIGRQMFESDVAKESLDKDAT
jgi:KRAB domain-containing zinc finger protein